MDFTTYDALSSPEGRRAADIALRLINAGGSRVAVKRAAYPTEDQALTLACKLIDVGVDCDEEDVMRAVALAKSSVPMRDLETMSR